MIQYMLQVAIAMALLIIPYFLFFRKETFFRFNRAYLLGAIAVAIIAPFAPRWIPVADPAIAFVVLQPIGISSMGEVTVTADAMSQLPALWNLLSIGYWMVVMLLIGKLIIEIAGIARIYQRGKREVYNGETIVVHEEIKAPFSFFNAVFLSPEIRNDRKQFAKIFKHEATHIQLNHSIDAVLVELLCAVFWINPLIYVYKRALKSIHEYQADNVVEETDLIEYTQLLLAQSQSGLRLALTNQFFQSQLKSRIIMMMKQRSHELNKWKYLFALPVVAISILLFSFKSPDGISVNDINERLIVDQSIVFQDTLPKDRVYIKADEMPRFPGCEEVEDKEKKYLCSQKLMLQQVYKNIKYPAKARSNSIQGMVIVQFNVSSTGEVVDVKLVKGIGGGCDEESIRVVNGLNYPGSKWTPGKIDGKPVTVKMTLPIKFKLNSNKVGPAKVMLAEGESSDVVVTAFEKSVKADGEVYKVVEDMPLFPGTSDAQSSQQRLVEYIVENLKYPDQAREDKLEGRVVVTFVVEPNGAISSIKVPRGLSPACDAEVIRIVESMNSMKSRWTSGRQKGEKVRVQFALPVMFKL